MLTTSVVTYNICKAAIERNSGRTAKYNMTIRQSCRGDNMIAESNQNNREGYWNYCFGWMAPVGCSLYSLEHW